MTNFSTRTMIFALAVLVTGIAVTAAQPVHAGTTFKPLHREFCFQGDNCKVERFVRHQVTRLKKNPKFTRLSKPWSTLNN